MRQVGDAELVWTLKYALSRLSQSVRNDLASRDATRRGYAVQAIAERLAHGALGRYELLSDAPLPEGSDLYSAAAFGSRGSAAPVAE